MKSVTRKKGTRDIDVRDGLFSLDIDRPTDVEAEALQLSDDQLLLRLRIDLGVGAHVRAEEFAQAVFGLDDERDNLVVARTNLFRLVQGEIEDVLERTEAAIPTPRVYRHPFRRLSVHRPRTKNVQLGNLFE